MFYRRRSGTGINRWVVKSEHVLAFAIFLVAVSTLLLIIASTIQAGRSDLVNAVMISFLTFLGATPWYIWLIIDIVGVVFLVMAGGRGE